MEEITLEKSLDFYLETLDHLDEKYLSSSDEDLKKIILEELDADAHTFLHHVTVNRLTENNIIPKSVEKDSLELRELIRKLIDTKYKIDEIRFDKNWIEAREIAKKILIEIESKRKRNQ
ncbi:MAG TPA: hypothetical protein VFS71_10785 [Flavobacterium sp.]|uniref:hypothetical protein n=1 Tax=Flavobacterium sp. TaxID=239 RepID=UPI002DB5C4F6|nr:hypothetical protein [Flavobacterium sp.]HEU4790163.1 hypothetical protein [Flavobacterium sp.]